MTSFKRKLKKVGILNNTWTPIAISLRSQKRVASHNQEIEKLSTYMMEDVAEALRQKSQICSLSPY